MFPGYVFTDSTLDETNFLKLSNECIKISKNIYKLLGNKNVEYMTLSEMEKNYLLSFCNDKYITEESKGFIVGDKIFINSGPLKGKESIIRKIDRHKRRAEIEMKCLGDKRKIIVSLEIVSKM